jgi:hypothetical protein
LRRSEITAANVDFDGSQRPVPDSSFRLVCSIGRCRHVFVDLARGTHIMGGERVTRAEWLHIAAPLVAAIGILMALICYAFASRKRWSRHLVIAMFTLIIVYASILGALNLIRHTIMWRAIINASISGAASVWYFYFKANVAAYFRGLAKQ